MTIRESGFRSLYTGLSASVLRQMTYSLVRLGAYEKMKASLSKDGPAPGSHLLLAAMLAGALGGLAGNPAGKHRNNHGVGRNLECMLSCTDILLVRMTSDFVRPPAERYNYSNAVSGMVTLVREEGAHGMFRGLGTNMVRTRRCPRGCICVTRLSPQTRAVLMNVSFTT